MISIIITSYKEPNTIGKCIKSVASREYSGLNDNDFELIQVSPDDETLDAGKLAARELRLGKKFFQIVDPGKGKPYALKLALDLAKGEIIIFTDGDSIFTKGSVKELLKPFRNEIVGGVTGRPTPINPRNSFFGYIAHLLTDAANHRRIHTLEKNTTYYVSGKTFFPMSGYIMAIRNIIRSIPSDVLSDDAYISYEIRNRGLEIAYTPKARVKVKFPTTLKDYYTQKVRSVGGYAQLERYGIFKRDKQSRSFWIELHYAFFTLRHPKNMREFFWALMFFPVRLMTWIKIYYYRVLLKRGMPKTGWERIESTK